MGFSQKKRTYTLPTDLLNQFEKEVAQPQRSTVIAGLLRGWLSRQEREQLRRDVPDDRQHRLLRQRRRRLDLHAQFEHAFESTRLPDRPDYEWANRFLIKARRSATGNPA